MMQPRFLQYRSSNKRERTMKDSQSTYIKQKDPTSINNHFQLPSHNNSTDKRRVSQASLLIAPKPKAFAAERLRQKGHQSHA
jgi:hypothetical protein